MKRVGALLACAIWLILSATSAVAGSAPATGEATAAAPKPPTVALYGDTTLTDQDQAPAHRRHHQPGHAADHRVDLGRTPVRTRRR